MRDLDDEIAELEARLMQLKAQQKGTFQQWIAPVGTNDGPPLTVNGPEDIQLESLPAFVRALLDALPVQIFIKEAAHVPGSGRRYLFLNAAARDILGWSPDEVRQHFDSDAVAGGFASHEYQAMSDQESTTLHRGVSRRRQLEWTAGSGDESWRRNRTLEIAILEKGGGRVGFCAIAEDIELQLLPALHSWLRMVFEHEYNNAGNRIWKHADTVERVLKQIAADSSVATRPELSALVDVASKPLEMIKKRVVMSTRVSGALIDAFARTHADDPQPAKNIYARLKIIYENPPFNLEMPPSQPTALERMVRKPNSVLGVLVELLGNAIKHSENSDTGAPVYIRLEETTGGVSWVVSNQAKKLHGRLKISKVIEAAPADRGPYIGSAVISELLSRAFPAERVEEMIQFPERLDHGWVHVRLCCSEEPDVERF